MAEPRYGGAYTPKEAEEGGSPDVKSSLEQACHGGCTKKWDIYEQCKARIEQKGHGDCVGYFMDYQHCLDHCTVSPRLVPRPPRCMLTALCCHGRSRKPSSSR